MPSEQRAVGRRTFLAGAAAAAAAAVACSSDDGRAGGPRSSASATASTAPPTTSTTAAASRFVSHGPRTGDQVALTFHVSGDRALAVQLLDLLQRRRVPITAFMVGSWLDANRDLAARFRADGHELANHTQNHLTFPNLDEAKMTSEVTGCRDALVRAAGTPGAFFRPSGTSNGTDEPSASTLAVAQRAGYATVVGFDVDPADYQDPGARAIAKRTADGLQPGSIVSLHFGHAGTIDAVPGILDSMAARGVRPVTLTTLLG